jgi:hypothetical protein
MRTLKSLHAEKASTPPARLMGFAEFCEHVYDPISKASKLNLSEADKQAVIESVRARCSSIPSTLSARLSGDRH